MKRKTRHFRRDLMWKGIIEDFFPEFLHYFFPKVVHEIDFETPFEFLDKELAILFPETNQKNRRADLLVKIFLKDGTEQWLIVHVEIQGYEDKEFPLRMFQYNYRSFEKFGKSIVALAIFTDENPDYCPSFYETKRWDTKLRYNFNTYKLLDYDAVTLGKSKNPFGVVMQTARTSIKNKALKNDDDLLELKVQLFRNMLSKGFDKQVILKITNFIKNYVRFNEPSFKTKFDNRVAKVSNQKQLGMGILEVVKREEIRIAKEEGFDEGIEKGIEKGVEKGIEKGRRLLLENQVLHLKAKGLSISDIADFIVISETEVLEIQNFLSLKEKIKEALDNQQPIVEIVKELNIEKDIIQEVIEKIQEK